MKAFPAVDVAGTDVVPTLFSDRDSFEMAHDIAEKQSPLYRFGHAALEATSKDIDLAPTRRSALMSGVRAFEVIGGIVGGEQPRTYGYEDIMKILSEMEHPTGNFSLDFLENLGEWRRSMVDETPALANAVDRLAQFELGDLDTDSKHLARSGAAAMRAAQIEIDQLLSFETQFDN